MGFGTCNSDFEHGDMIFALGKDILVELSMLTRVHFLEDRRCLIYRKLKAVL